MYLFIYLYLILLKFFFYFFFYFHNTWGRGHNNKILLGAHLAISGPDKDVSWSAFEEIWLYRATAHILSAAVLVPPYQYTVQRHKHSHQ